MSKCVLIVKSCVEYTEISNEELPSLRDISVEYRNALLKEAFERNSNPNLIEIIDLASTIGSNVYKIKAWFKSERRLRASRAATKAKGKLPKQFVYMSKSY